MGDLPTLYNHYTLPKITSGLSDNKTTFHLNGKPISIYSGAMHYFRVHPDYWRDRLRKMRACGLNTVETYVPWNLHESEPGRYDFGSGGTDFQEFLQLERFLKIAQEEDLLVIVRPGPYICAEWEFGGLPSWLLRHKGIKVRTSDDTFMHYVDRYFKILFSLLSVLQFVKGGPIIAFQIENEYGNVKVENEDIDQAYLLQLKEMYHKYGITELLFTSDTPSHGQFGMIPGILYTANFQNYSTSELLLLKTLQPQKPVMVMEYWTGWFDHWGEEHHVRSVKDFSTELEVIFKFPASVNFYMFHGGTNWGFMNGANVLDDATDGSSMTFDISSYDYDAPLTEAGDYTDKYFITRVMIEKYNTVHTKLPMMPKESVKVVYDRIMYINMMTLGDMISSAPIPGKSHGVLSMEELNINNGGGQSYGYIVYRKTNVDIPSNSVLKIEGRVCDSLMVLINGELKTKILSSTRDFHEFGFWMLKDGTLDLGGQEYKDATLDLVVENMGRNNYGKLNQFNQRKGIWQGDVSINDNVLTDWQIYPLEFKKMWTTMLKPFWNPPLENFIGPALYRFLVTVPKPHDTFIDMRDWLKGIIVVNGFVLSRYCTLGPQQTAYLPAPLLKEGENEILIFEHYKAASHLKFANKPIFETLQNIPL